MAYKTGFKPLEQLGRDGWRRMGEGEPDTGKKSIILPARRTRSRILTEA